MNGRFDVGRLVMMAGVALFALGFLITALGRIGFGRLPGDIAVRRPGFAFYFPLASCAILSLALTLLAWFFRRR